MSLMRRQRRAIAMKSKGEFKIHVCGWLAGHLFAYLDNNKTNVCEILVMMIW
jgi:hypothetical protein